MSLLVEHLFAEQKRENEARSSASDRKRWTALRATLFAEQLAFIDDPWRFKSLLCARRAGKSYAAAIYLLCTCLARAGAVCAYITLTKGSGRNILWGLLKKLNDEYELGISFHNTYLVASFPNGSQIQFHGAEEQASLDKLRGQAFDLVIIDESKSFPARVLDELIDEVLGATLDDHLGTLCMIGTPGSVLAGEFWRATSDAVNENKDPIARPFAKRRGWTKGFKWSFHSWSRKANVALPHLWAVALEKKEQNGWADDNPRWLREYMGIWVADDSMRVYRYDADRCGWGPEDFPGEPLNEHGLPAEHEWRYILGLDLGFEDECAFVVAAYSETSPHLYHVYDWGSSHLTVSQLAKRCRALERIFGGFDAIVADTGGLGKQVVETLVQEYGIPIEAAEKREKLDFIELLNSDLTDGRVRVRRASRLADEMGHLQWEDKTRGLEDPHCTNHRCDAFLYLWRYSLHRWGVEERPDIPEPGTPEHADMLADEALEKARARARQREQQDWWELDDDGWDDDSSLFGGGLLDGGYE